MSLTQTTTNFFMALPAWGWHILALLLVLWFILHAYEGYQLQQMSFPYTESIQNVKRLFKPALLITAAAMALAAIFSTAVLPKNNIDKRSNSVAQLHSDDAAGAAQDTTERVPKPQKHDAFKHDLNTGQYGKD
jgi:amino acid transporter